MKRSTHEEMHRIADAYLVGCAWIEHDPAHGEVLVAHALAEARGLGQQDERTGVEAPPGRFLSYGELLEAWEQGHAASALMAVERRGVPVTSPIGRQAWFLRQEVRRG